MRKITVVPIQDMKKEYKTIVDQNNVRLVNYENFMRNPDSSTGIYLTADNVAQCIMVADNRREKEKAKK